jgi:hypothetical protein
LQQSSFASEREGAFAARNSILFDFYIAGANWPQSHAVQQPVANDERVEQHSAEVKEKNYE